MVELVSSQREMPERKRFSWMQAICTIRYLVQVASSHATVTSPTPSGLLGGAWLDSAHALKFAIFCVSNNLYHGLTFSH